MNNRDLLNAYMCAIEMRENASSSQQYDELGEEMDRLCEEILNRMGGEEMSNEKSGVDEYEEMYCDVCGGTACFC